MVRLLLPILLAILGTGAGVGAGLYLAPAGHKTVTDHGSGEDGRPAAPVAASEGIGRDYARLNNQFVVPIVSDEGMQALVVMALSLEVVAGQTQAVYSKEPKLRDAVLQVLFGHANLGGFDGAFTRTENMELLRRNLLETARHVVGDAVTGILILDIARQDT